MYYSKIYDRINYNSQRDVIMREELIKTLLNEYKETEKALELGMDLLSEKDYAKGKLDLVKVIIGDLEKLSKEA